MTAKGRAVTVIRFCRPCRALRPPANSDAGLRIRVTTLRQLGVHNGRGIRRRDEENDEHDQHQRRHDLRAREVVQDGKEDVLGRWHGVDRPIGGNTAIAALQPDRSATQDGESADNDGGRNKQDAQDVLADGAAAGDLSHEDANKG